MADQAFLSNAVRTGNVSGWARSNNGIGLVLGRVASNGTHPIGIVALFGACSGYSGSVSGRMVLGSASAPFAVAAAGAAQDTGWWNCSSPWYVLNGGTAVFGYYDMTGRFYFGRSAATGGSDIETASGAWAYGGSLGGAYRYAQVPTAPQSLTASSPEPGVARLAWAGPADNGGTPITSYSVRRATNAAMSENVTNTDVGNVATVDIEGLTSGVRYYFQVFAKNAVTNAFSTGSVGSNQANVLIQSGGKRWDGTLEQPITTLARWNGSAEVPITVAMRWDGAAEVPLSS